MSVASGRREYNSVVRIAPCGLHCANCIVGLHHADCIVGCIVRLHCADVSVSAYNLLKNEVNHDLTRSS